MTGQVTAQVILKSADGSSVLTREEPITAENIAKYRVGKEVIAEVSKKLEKLGFKVLQAGPLSLSISSDKALFERVFHTTLETRSAETMGTKTSGAVASYYTATAPIEIPEDLSAQVADIALPTPPEFFP